MKVTAYKTHKIKPNENIYAILDTYLPQLKEKNIVVIASKVVGICEGRVVKIQRENTKQKETLVKKEAEYYLLDNHMGFLLTINQNMLVANAGIDESNSNGYFSLWPKDPQKSANDFRAYLIKKHKVNDIGVIFTDSKLSPLRWGVTGYCLAYSGFRPINSYVGKKDIFGEKMRVEQSNFADSFAAASVAVMGEGNEQQPLTVITDVPFITFQKRNPTKKELDGLKIKLEDDIYASLLTAVKWKKGNNK